MPHPLARSLARPFARRLGIALAALALAALALPACGPAPELEVGVGEGRFNSFVDGETLDLVSGCQGSQHVWTALRTRGLDPRSMIVDLRFVRDRDSAVVSAPFLVRVTLDPNAGWDEQSGLTLVVPEPDEAIGEDLTLVVTATDRDDVSLTVERPVRIDWGAGGCR